MIVMGRFILDRMVCQRRRFACDQSGAALVEFALVFPLMLLFFAFVMETGRVLWTYQIAVSGVRDAGRYLARIAPIDICLTGGSLSGYATSLQAIVEDDLGGDGIFPASVTINSVAPSIACYAGSYRTDPAPVATVSASMTVTFPLASVFTLFTNAPTTFTTVITDQSRVFGL